MIGKNDRQESAFYYFRMHEMIPAKHPLRVIDKHIDFSFVRERVRGLYSHTGRPSVDPEVMARMLLIGYLYGISSERRLCEEVAMHIGYRWFVGLGMDDKVPDHSTFSKNRHGRFESGEIWREIFDEVVRKCVEVGLVSGKHLTADGTLVAADASMSRMTPIVVDMEPAEYIGKMDAQSDFNGKDPDGGRENEFPNKGEKISNDTHRSKTDPDARIARQGKYSATKLSYQVSYLMDNTSRVILDAVVSGKCGRRA